MNLRLLAYYYKRFSWIPYSLFSLSDRIDNPIFLVGNQGDGLSFISRILRRNPAVYSVTGKFPY